MYIKDNYINSELIELNNFIIKQEKIITQQQKEYWCKQAINYTNNRNKEIESECSTQ